MKNTIIEDYIEAKPDAKSEVKSDEKLDDIEIKRESLAILASLGSTKEYLGEHLNLGDINKLEVKDVAKYYDRYQIVLGKRVSGGLIESFIRIAVKGISCILPLYDPEYLVEDLQGDELVNRELSNISGQLVLRGGRLVALGSAMFHVVRNIDPRPTNLTEALEIDSGVDEHTPCQDLRDPVVDPVVILSRFSRDSLENLLRDA